MQKHHQINIIAYYISQYSWILLPFFLISYSIIFPEKTNSIVIQAQKEKSFDPSQDPLIFGHISDTHISIYDKNTVKSFENQIQYFNSIKPSFILHTGDIVDNYDTKHSYPHYGDQIVDNWMLYKQISEKSNVPIIESFGNHDMFGIKNILNSNVIKYSNTFNSSNVEKLDDFVVHSFQIHNQNIIVINPFTFPTAHPPLVFFQNLSTKVLNMIENEVSKHPKSLILSHYPLVMLNSQYFSSKKQFKDIIGDQNVRSYFSGHTHPKEVQIYHYGTGGIEFIAPTSFFAQKFGVVTLDNEALIWSLSDITNPLKGVISYPPPKSQISHNNNFNEKNIELRIIMFSGMEDLKIDISGSVTGTLNFSRKLPNGASLYTYPLHLENGDYNLKFSGDFEGNLEFVIKEKYLMEGKKITYPMKRCRYLLVSLPIIWIFLILITFVSPYKIGMIEYFCGNTEIDIENSISTNRKPSLLFLFFFGFLIVRTRFQKIPAHLKILVFFFVLYPIALPLMFFRTEGELAFVMVYGYFIHGQYHPAMFTAFYTFMYLIFVCYPMIIMCSSFGVNNWSIYQSLDILVAVGCIFADIFCVYRLVYESTGPNLFYTSPCFIIIPIIEIFSFILWRVLEKSKRRSGHLGSLSPVELASIPGIDIKNFH